MDPGSLIQADLDVVGSNPTVTAILGRIDFLLRRFRSGSFLLDPPRSVSDVGTAVVRGFPELASAVGAIELRWNETDSVGREGSGWTSSRR
jgi:hypothetical protein